MTQRNLISLGISTAVWVACVMVGMPPASAGPPSVVHANIDYDASGYVTPAGMADPSMYYGGVMPVGYLGAGCDSCGGSSYGGCDSCQSCDSGCDASCNGRCGIFSGGGLAAHRPLLSLGGGGLLGKMANGGGLRPLCFFCRGGGCSACQMLGGGYLLGALQSLRPYCEAGQCAQRWYDLSAEALFLSHSNGSLSGGVTSQDPLDPNGTIVLSLGDADGGNDLEEGMRLSASFIFGAGGNIEGTYMGNNKWNSEAAVFSNPANSPTLFSFVSNFGGNPPGGFQDTDRSIVQSVASQSEFHSGELNYRRRTMGPYCRFQGSWLVGLRYVRFENGLLYSTLGDLARTRFFSSNDYIKNNLFGPQAGFDLWWNVMPGVNLGIGMKGAWVQNDADRRTTLLANSIAPTVITDKERDTTVMGEFEAKLVYRLSHSWSFRSAYYAIAIDDIAFGIADGQTIRDFVIPPTPITPPDYQFHSLVVQGFSFGAEYMW